MFSPICRITAGVSTFMFLISAAPSYAQQLDLNDFIAPVQGGSTAVNGPVDDGETVHAKTMQDGMNYAHKILNDDDEDGIRVVSTATGMGTISRASANYSIYANPNATLLSKRTAYAEAYMAAKKQLIANLNPIQNTCNAVLESELVALDTGMDSAANVNRRSTEICGEAVSGMLAAYVVYDVNDDTDNREVSISIATSTKTRNAFLRLNPAVIRSTDPNAAFSYVINEITNYATPPMGAKLITHPETGEQIVIGFGSSVIRKNNNSTVAKKLKKMSRDQSGIRARNALVAFLRGDDLYWSGGFDEDQIESTEQFVIPVDEQGNAGDPQILNQDRDVFLNTISMSDSYDAVTSGQVPEGVQTKSFESADGNWYFSIAVFSQSARAIAQNTAQENNAAVDAIDATPSPLITTQPSNSSGMNMDGGMLENGANPQGPSGQVSDAKNRCYQTRTPLTMKALLHKTYLLLILMGGMISAPHQGIAKETPDMAMVIADVIARHDSLSGLFAKAEINTIGVNKASVFASNAATRYALVVIPLRDGVKAKEISEPFCRSRLMTPEAAVMTADLYHKTNDDMVISVLVALWQSQGAINGSEAFTSIFDEEGFAMTLCKVEDSGVTTGFVEVDNDLLTQAELIIARRLYEAGDADLLQQRMEHFYSENQLPDAAAYLAIAFWLKGEYEAGFTLDEVLGEANFSDTWLKQQYEMRFDEAVEKYFSAALKDSQSDN